MKPPKPVVIDFETHGIEGRPKYPPIPVGVSIKYPGKKAKYYAFGHPSENNCCYSDAEYALIEAWAYKGGLLFQNSKFDVDVAEVHFGMTLPDWQSIHDTMFLLFLDDPHQQELGLKPSAHRLLGIPPDEQDEVADWLIANQPIKNVKIGKSKSSDHYFGRYVAYAPGNIVGKYANGDTDRTEKIFNLLWPKIEKQGMLTAYDRERELMPILLDMERQGVPVDLRRLRSDVKMYNDIRDQIHLWVIKQLKADPTINLDSGEQLVKAMVTAGKADPDLMPRTPTGKFQTNKEALLVGVTDKVLLAVLRYRTQLNTCLNTFMEPWLRVAEQSNGLIFTTWNQVKAPRDDRSAGTRTGRLSSTPNFQNIPNLFAPIFAHQDPKNKKLPKCPFKDLPPLPLVRSYVVPFKGEVLIDRDYSQQELRILAHFDGGSMLDKYIANPWIDFHDDTKAELEKMGKFYERKPVKNTNFGLIYGMGVGKLAIKNDTTVEEASDLKKSILKLYPGLKSMYQDMKVRAKTNEPIRTWGGRVYYCEEPKIVDGRLREFDYKLVNVLVQGSAADCTKEGIIRHHRTKHKLTRLILNVHDQLTASTPPKLVKTEMQVLKDSLESVEFDVKMLSEGSTSKTNWYELKDYDKKGVLVCAPKYFPLRRGLTHVSRHTTSVQPS